MTRKKIPDDILNKLFYMSMRRCALCFGVDNDFLEKDGQVAHLNKDNSDNRLENLVWLCLKHHNKYDSKTSQSKNYTQSEVKQYRDLLYNYVNNYRMSSNQALVNEKKAIIDALNDLFHFMPYSYLLKEIVDFPCCTTRICGVFEVWENFKNPNPHIYPFSDRVLTDKFDAFFYWQDELEKIVHTYFIRRPYPNEQRINSFIFGEPDGSGYCRMSVNSQLSADESAQVYSKINEIKLNYDSRYNDLTQYIRSNYPEVNINSFYIEPLTPKIV